MNVALVDCVCYVPSLDCQFLFHSPVTCLLWTVFVPQSSYVPSMDCSTVPLRAFFGLSVFIPQSRYVPSLDCLFHSVTFCRAFFLFFSFSSSSFPPGR